MIKTGILILPFLVSCAYAQEAQPINLNKAVEIALQNNYALKSSFENINIAKGNLKANLFPSTPSIGLEHNEIPSGNPFNSARERSYFIQQEIPFPLRYPLLSRSLKSQVASAKAGYEQQKLGVKISTRNRYMEWLASISLIGTAKENVSLSEDFHKSSQQLYNAGEIGAIPLSRAHINLSQAKLQLENANIAEHRKRAELLTILALPDDVLLIPEDSLTQLNVLSNIMFYDTTAQPNLNYSRSLVQQANANYAYQRSALLPDITFSYLSQIIDGQRGFYGIGVSMEVPLWYFNYKGELQRNKAVYRQNLYNYQQAKLSFDNDFKALQQSISHYQNIIEEYTKMKNEAAKLVQYAREAYQVGEMGYLEYLDAQRSYLDVKNILINTFLNYQLTLTDYQKITGGF